MKKMTPEIMRIVKMYPDHKVRWWISEYDPRYGEWNCMQYTLVICVRNVQWNENTFLYITLR